MFIRNLYDSGILQFPWPQELKELKASAPCVALRRVIEEGVLLTLPGFDSETSAAVLAGVRQTFIIFFVRVQY